MTRRVLVTRPQPGASSTVGKLAARSHMPIVLPLTAIRGIDPAASDLAAIDLGSIDAVAITSANAVRHAPVVLLAALSARPSFAVGAATAAEARRAGFSHTQDVGADVDLLSLTLLARTEVGSRILYLCGRVRRNELEDALTGAGRTMVAVETYDTVAIDHDPAEAAARIGTDPITDILVYSAHGADTLCRLVEAEPLMGLRQARVLALSSRIATRLDQHFAEIAVAAEPNEDALLALLETES